MRVLKNTKADVLDGWFFYVEQTGMVVKGHTFEKLLEVTKNHLKVNELDIDPLLDVIIQDQISKRIPTQLSKPYER